MPNVEARGGADDNRLIWYDLADSSMFADIGCY